VAFSPDGQRLALRGHYAVWLWDTASGKALATLAGHTGWVLHVAFSPDGSRLASGGQDRMVRLWDTASGKLLVTLTGHTDSVWQVAFSPDGRRLASAGEDAVRLWIAQESPQDRERRRWSWPEQHAESAELHADWFAAAFYLGQLLQRQPQDAYLHVRRGIAYAQQKQWKLALADFAEAQRLKPDSAGPWYLLGLVLLASGDEAGYRQICTQMLQRFAATKNPGAASIVVRLAVLRPHAVADMAALVRLAEEVAVKSKPESADYRETLGAALYRAGRHTEAVKQVDQAVQLQRKGGTVTIQLFLALAHHHLGHADQARSWLEKADVQMQKRRDQIAMPLFWNDELLWKVLRQEAADQLKPSKP
jgi:Flp pilus assembly protein TadD